MMFGLELKRIGYAVTRSDGSVTEYAMEGVMHAVDSLFASGNEIPSDYPQLKLWVSCGCLSEFLPSSAG